MRRLAALGLAVALAGCLKPSAHTCSGGWTCPAGLECADTPTFCGSPAEVAACKGAADFTACSTTAVADGFCQGGACQTCVTDYEVCPAHTWSPMTYAGPDLTSVFVDKPGSAIAVGAGSVAHWDGLTWTAMQATPTDTLRSVWVPPEGGAAWIVSNVSIYRWDGTTLTTVATPMNTGPAAVWASSQTDIYVVGTSATILHGDGTSMFTTAQLAATSRTLQAVGGSSATDVYVVGTGGTLAHLEGGMWVLPTLPMDVGLTALRGVWADAPNDVFVVGNATTILHFDGTTWTHSPAAADVTGLNLRSVWGSGPADVFAVGDDAGNTTGTILHFDGSMWTTMQAEPVALSAIAGSGPHEVIAVGATHTVLRYTGP